MIRFIQIYIQIRAFYNLQLISHLNNLWFIVSFKGTMKMHFHYHYKYNLISQKNLYLHIIYKFISLIFHIVWYQKSSECSVITTSIDQRYRSTIVKLQSREHTYSALLTIWKIYHPLNKIALYYHIIRAAFFFSFN